VKEASAIRRDVASDKGTAAASERDLLLYLDNDDAAKMPKNGEILQSQRDEELQRRVENLLKSYESNGLYRDNRPRFSLGGFPKAIKLQTDANQNFNSDRKNHGKAEIENRFPINHRDEGEEVENVGSAGAINHHYHGQDIKTSIDGPDEIDIRVRFGAASKQSRGESPL
jgi:hypothetical protein